MDKAEEYRETVKIIAKCLVRQSPEWLGEHDRPSTGKILAHPITAVVADIFTAMPESVALDLFGEIVAMRVANRETRPLGVPTVEA